MNLPRQIDLDADVEEAERKRREIAALEMLAFVGKNPPGAGALTVAGERLFLMAAN